MCLRGLGPLLPGDEIAAEPVPVRRPGVYLIGDGEADCSELAGSYMGKMKIGLNLE